MQTRTLSKLCFYAVTAVFFGSLHSFATQHTTVREHLNFVKTKMIDGQEIQNLMNHKGVLSFECPKEGNSIEIYTEKENIRATGYRVDENLHEILDKKIHDKGTVLYGKKQRTISFLSIKANKGDSLNCHGYFTHSKHFLFQGLYFTFNKCVFSPGSMVTIQPKTLQNQNILKYLRLVPVDITLPIYAQGRVDLKNLVFDTCDMNYPSFFTINANVEFLLK